MNARRRDSAGPIVAMIAASVLLHLLMWPIGNTVVRWGERAAPLPRTESVIEVSLLPTETSEESDERLVKLDRVDEERAPQETRNVSEFDSRTERETRAPQNRPRPGATPSAPPPPANAPGSASSSSDARALPLGGRDGLAGNRSRSDNSTPGAESDARSATDTSFSPRSAQNLDALRQQWGTPGTFDDVDAEEGDSTVLNSRRWKFASFFNRVRDQIANHWHPETLHAANDPDASKYGTKTRHTKLFISLNPDGSLHRIRLEKSSDVGYLDEEAIRAVRAAQPFSNPPAGLIDPTTGLIEFGFGFIFEIHGRTKIFRYQR